MADGLFTLIVLSMVMALASFAAGMLPLAISLSQKRLRLLSTLGMGVLVGTSLIVIIPEGIDTLYTTHGKTTQAIGTRHVAQTNYRRHDYLSSGGLAIETPKWPLDSSIGRTIQVRQAFDKESSPTSPGVGAGDDDDTSTLPNVPGANSPVVTTPILDHEHDHIEDHEDASQSSAHRYVGLSLISGFILMYLIDQLPHTHALSSHSHTYSTISVHTLRSFSNAPADEPSASARKSFSTTLGLVIHAAADGIALGASSASSNSALEFIVFFAIMLHKAPAAFGLSTVLLRTGLTKRQARSHLIVFSLAAPAGALVTWVIVGVLGARGTGVQWWTGVLLLFSGGTFLYVAMHTMQETASSRTSFGNGDGNDVELNMNSFDDDRGGMGGGGSGRRQEEKTGLQDIIVAVAGMLLPLITQVGHHH